MTPEPDLPQHVFRDVIACTNDAVVITSAAGVDPPHPRMVYVNQAFTAITGYTAVEAIGRSPRMLQGPGTDRAALDRIRTALVAGTSCREEILNYDRAGRGYWLDVHIVPLLGRDGRILYFAAIERDVTAQRNRRARLERLAHEDMLTGLANRAAFVQAMQALLDSDESGRCGHTLVMLDLDGFKEVNDRHGHAAGDDVLRRFAAAILNVLRRDDCIARLGGDEFAVVLPRTAPADARALASRIIRTAGNLAVRAEHPALGVSAGIAGFRSGDKLDEVMSRADRALYTAKAEGKGVVRVARPALLA